MYLSWIRKSNKINSFLFQTVSGFSRFRIRFWNNLSKNSPPDKYLPRERERERIDTLVWKLNFIGNKSFINSWWGPHPTPFTFSTIYALHTFLSPVSPPQTFFPPRPFLHLVSDKGRAPMISPHRNWLNDRDRAGKGGYAWKRREREIIRKDMGGHGRGWVGMGGYERVWEGMGRNGRVWEGMGGYGRVWKRITGYRKVCDGIS